MAVPTRKPSTHDCPCGCRAQIPRHRFSCYDSWQRLPVELKRAITGNYRRNPIAHARAMGEARAWLRDEPAVDTRCEFRYEDAADGEPRRCANDKADDTDHCRGHWWAEP